MKRVFVIWAAAAGGFFLVASVPCTLAQIDVETTYEQTQFLAYQPLQVRVAITNNFARAITLETDKGQPWLVFDVIDHKGHPVPSRASSPQFPSISIQPGQTVGRTLEIQDLFYIQRPGSYKIQAVVYFEGENYGSARRQIGIASGQVIWQKKVALLPQPQAPIAPPASGQTDSATNKAPAPSPKRDEARTYQLIRFTTEKGQQLFFKLMDEEYELIYQCYSLGPLLLQRPPEVFLEPTGWFYVLHEAAPRNYIFSVIGTDGLPKIRESYTSVLSRPTLGRDVKGKIGVLGGEKYVSPTATEAGTTSP